MPARLTKEQYIQKLKDYHGDSLDFSKVVYTKSTAKVTIVCPKHGEYSVQARSALNRGCRKCSSERHALDYDTFVQRSKKLYGDLFEYSDKGYKNLKSEVNIRCVKHGVFRTKPINHLKGIGCPGCRTKSIRLTHQEFLAKARSLRGDEFDYSKTNYVKSSEPVIVTCRLHGDFSVTPNNHLAKSRGGGCRECQYNKLRNTKEEFVEKATKVHGQFDYSKVVYKNNNTKVIIGCPEHGDFAQIPRMHISGVGCPECNASTGEKEVAALLDEYKIRYAREQKFEGCTHRGPLRFDFYLPDHNLLIEYQGELHYMVAQNGNYGGEAGLKLRQKRDQIKKDWVENHPDLRLLEIRYDENIEDKLTQVFRNYP